MEVFYQSLGSRLIEQAKSTSDQALLAAPFIKQNALERVLSAIPSGCTIRVVTRWKLSEIAAGVSDLGIWTLLRESVQHSLELQTSLHAKYYRFDTDSLAGSANLTSTALGWHDQPNLEFLCHFEASQANDFEEKLGGIEVTESIYLRYRQLLKNYEEAHPDLGQVGVTYLLPEKEIPIGEVAELEGKSDADRAEQPEWWIPSLRHPEALYRVYSSSSNEVSTSTWNHGSRDLRYFDLRKGLAEQQFDVEISWQLLQKPVVQEVDQFVNTSKRFGAVRDHLRTLPCAENEDFEATGAWQTLMRWLLYFLGDRYRQREANYSEIFVRVE